MKRNIIILVIFTILFSTFAIVSAESKLKYEFKKEAVLRADKVPTHFILISKINLKNDDFKKDIKALIDEIVNKKSGKISLEIYDDAKALSIDYKDQTSKAVKMPTKKEMDMLGLHHVAGYEGNLNNGAHFNTLYFFISTVPETEKYSETIEYNAGKNPITDQEHKNAKTARKEKIADRLSQWDGSHPAVVKAVKESLKNPASFEHVKTIVTDMGDKIVMTYRGTNSFGAVVTEKAVAEISENGDIINIKIK